MDNFRRAFAASIPVLFGYIPLGITFGILFGRLGLPWYFATLSGLVVYAGAAQYLSVGLLAAGAGLTSIFIATLALNLRHAFYGLSMLDRYSGARGKLYLIYGLTDETYSVLAANPDADPLLVTALNHGYWVLGCSIGAWIGPLPFNGLEFVLTALFVVLAVEQALTIRRARPFLLAACSSVVALILWPTQFLLASMSLAFGGLWLTRPTR